MKKLSVGLCLLATALLMSSCGGDDDKKAESLIDPADANALAAAVTIANSSRETGNPPPPSAAGGAVVTATVANTTSSNGSTTPVSFNFQNGGAPVGAYVQVVGANSYFDAAISNPTNATAGQVTIPVSLPTNLNEGEFDLAYCVYDNNGNVSNIQTLSVNVLRLGTGSLQISLSWNAPNDQDLYVLEPSGNEINYGNPFSDSGGELDRDDTDGYGPENIFWSESAPDGQYTVSVDDFSGSGATCYITISAAGTTRNYTVTTNNNKVQVVTFTKNGNSFSF